LIHLASTSAIYTLSLHDALPILPKVSAIAPEMATPPSGTYPEFTPLAKVSRSGTTSYRSAANHSPVRPNPAITSSSTKTMPYLRSEEHTSELQSRENLVCRLLLE